MLLMQLRSFETLFFFKITLANEVMGNVRLPEGGTMARCRLSEVTLTAGRYFTSWRYGS
jgi:hypothetical protein